MTSVEIEGIEVSFPYEPYKCQLDYMRRVIECLNGVCFISKYSAGLRPDYVKSVSMHEKWISTPWQCLPT